MQLPEPIWDAMYDGVMSLEEALELVELFNQAEPGETQTLMVPPHLWEALERLDLYQMDPVGPVQ